MILSLLRSGPVVILFSFLFVFGAPVKGVPLNTAKLTLLVAINAFGLILVKRWIRGEFKLAPAGLYIAVAASLFLLFYSALLAIIHQTGDYALSYNFSILIVENILGSYIFYRVFLDGKSSSQILDVFVWIGLIQSLIIITMLVNVPFREFAFEQFANETTIQMSERYGGVRGFGVAGSVTYDLSVLLSIFMIFSAYQLCDSSKSQLFYIFAWLLSSLAVMVSGRTGFLGVLLSLGVILSFSRKRKALLGAGKLIMIASASVVSLLVLIHSLYPEIWALINEFLIPYAFEMFFSAAEGDGFNTNSSDILKEMYFPVTERTFWMGDARWLGDGGNGYYMHTDAGYMRHILFYGFIGSLVLYVLFGGLFLYLYLECERNWKVLFLMVAGYAFIVHVKGDFFSGSSMNAKVFFLLFAFVMWQKRNRRMKGVGDGS